MKLRHLFGCFCDTVTDLRLQNQMSMNDLSVTHRALTLTDQQLVIINEAHRTFTTETANHVDTHAVLTHAGNLTALIDVCGSQDGCEVLEEHADTEL